MAGDRRARGRARGRGALSEPAGRRTGTVERTTRETSISLRLDLDGGEASIATGVDFFDHMLDALAKHAGLGLVIRATGDGMDHHHVVEDVAIALGAALHEAFGDKRGIARFGSQAVPLDEALVLASVDISGRGHCTFAVRYPVENLGALKTEMIPHFFRSLAENGRFTLHLRELCGENAHHLCEATFKAFARALAQAKAITGDGSIPSTKGLLA